MRKAGPGLGWKLFAGLIAVVMLVGDVPRLLNHPSLVGLAVAAINFTALAGLAAYAARRRCLPARFWRVFAPAYCLFCAGQLGWAAPKIAGVAYKGQGAPASVLAFLIVVVPAVSATIFLCIALLRQAELLGPGRRPWGSRPAQLALALPDPA